MRTEPPSSGERTTVDLLLSATAGSFHRFVVMTDQQADACALWVAHTHVIEAFRMTPYLNPQSATKQSGKTRLLEVLRPLCARSIDTDGMTPAALVRTVDVERPTLLLDETDSSFNGSKELAEALRGILNSGFRARGNFRKCVGEGANVTVRSYSTFGAKAIAGIGQLPDTVADRSIPVRLRRRAPGERIEEFFEEEWEEDAKPIANGLAGALASKRDKLASARPIRPDGISDRAKDAWKPLLAIADLAGGEWPARARHAAQVLCGHRELDEEEIGIRLLGALCAAFERRDTDKLTSSELVAYLHEQKDEPWADWSRGNPISARKVADLLRPFEIRPKDMRTNEGTKRGYELKRCEDAFGRYLPRMSNPKCDAATDPPETALESQKLPSHLAPEMSSGRTLDPPQKPHEQANVADVALSDADTGENDDVDPLFGDIDPDPMVGPPPDPADDKRQEA
jgi:Protein of unknown function (DUF3631)